MMLPSVAATRSSAGSSLASGSRRRAGINDPFRAQPWRVHHHWRPGASPAMAWRGDAALALGPWLASTSLLISAVPDTFPLVWLRRLPRRGLVAMITAAIAPSPTAVRKDGFGSHFIALKTISGGSLACGAERETGWCPVLEIGACSANRSRQPRTKGMRSWGPRLVARLPSRTNC
jgi:hypothetical protein